MSEFVEGFEALRNVGPAVSIFGSARARRSDWSYKAACKVAETLSRKGYAVISGGGPGIMEAANRGAKRGKGLSIGLNIMLPEEQRVNRYQDKSLHFKHFFARKVMFVKYAAGYVIMAGGVGTPRRVLGAAPPHPEGKDPPVPRRDDGAGVLGRPAGVDADRDGQKQDDLEIRPPALPRPGRSGPRGRLHHEMPQGQHPAGRRAPEDGSSPPGGSAHAVGPGVRHPGRKRATRRRKRS